MKKYVGIALGLFVLIVIVILAIGVYGQKSNNTSQDQVTNNTTVTDDQTATYVPSEVAGHNLANDCWVIIKDKVYDVTDFIAVHPGGPEAIIPNCGTEATTVFTTRNKPEPSDHPPQAYDNLVNLYIGDLVK
ncbi:MAG: cytochrome b5-like heme/steroid binding domain-containing protein [Patescibacteria group bacterium]